MKKYVYVLVAVLGLSLTACGNAHKKTTAEAADATASAATGAQYVEDLLASAETNVGKEITLRGFITHTCKHSGKRCFVVGKDQKTSIRVEAKGNIGGFNRELIGSEVLITGTLRESRLTKEYINQMEEAIREKKVKDDGSAESCDAETANIAGMRQWMKDHHKDFYSIYYVDGTGYEVVEE